MNTTAINQINNKLKVIPDNFVNDVLQYLEFLYFKNSANEFVLSDEQVNLLDKRSKTPIENCIPAESLKQQPLNSWATKYKGAMSKQPINDIDNQLNELRNEWE